MPLWAIQERVRSLTAGSKTATTARTGRQLDLLQVVTPDSQADPMPDLATPRGQDQLAHLVDAAQLLVLDNLSCLSRAAAENDGEAWIPLLDWLLELRRARKTVLFIHHPGKTGKQRGTSRREDALDLVLKLRRPRNAKKEAGARIVVSSEKDRHQVLPLPIEAALVPSESGGLRWDWKAATHSSFDQVVAVYLRCLKEGGTEPTQASIARELGVSAATVCRRMGEARALGVLD